MEADYVEVVAANDAGLDLAGSPRPIMVKPEVEKSPKAVRFLRWRASPGFRHRECHVFVAETGSALADVDQPSSSRLTRA